MFLERAIESILIFICLGLEKRVPLCLEKIFPILAQHEFLVFVGWWILLIAVYLVLVALLKIVLRSFPALSGQYPQTALRGTWLQKVGNERPWGVACIKYDSREDRWIYKGVGFDDAMNFAAQWETYGHKVTKQKNDDCTWGLVGEGTLWAEQDGIPKETSRFDIAVLLKFPKEAKRYGVTGKAADLNFQSTTHGVGNQDDLVFGLRLTFLGYPESILHEVRQMTPAQRRELFAPLTMPTASQMDRAETPQGS